MLKEKHEIKEDRWVSASEAMENSASKAKQHCKGYVMKGEYVFSQADKKNILHGLKFYLCLS
ncbi:MAG: hypothetical protein H0W62_05905 [Chitinophagales bacterium]|nr:hypothetical protein [Chitinophagales bacterium]